MVLRAPEGMTDAAARKAPLSAVEVEFEAGVRLTGSGADIVDDMAVVVVLVVSWLRICSDGRVQAVQQPNLYTIAQRLSRSTYPAN